MSAFRPSQVPVWYTVLVILFALPVFQTPLLLDSCPPHTDARTWVMIYPLYVIAAAWIAWQSYPERRTLAWIILALMLLTHAAIWYLVMTAQPTQLF